MLPLLRGLGAVLGSLAFRAIWRVPGPAALGLVFTCRAIWRALASGFRVDLGRPSEI